LNYNRKQQNPQLNLPTTANTPHAVNTSITERLHRFKHNVR
jgi:hypothetical protein